MPAKDAQIVVRIPAELDKKIIKAAKKKGLTKASLMRTVMIDYLDATNPS